MKRQARAAVISRLRDLLDQNGSWCGETHVQKATYFLQHAAEVPLGYNFILYKHGPFAFDLREDLGDFRADGLLELRPQAYPYGPRLGTTDEGHQLQSRFPKTLGRYNDQMVQIAKFIGANGVGALERLATALMILKQAPAADDAAAAAEMRRLKPHVTESQALAAVASVRRFVATLTPADAVRR